VDRTAVDRGRDPLGGIKSDECKKGWRLRPLQNSSCGGAVASKHRQGQWIVILGSSMSLQDKLVELPSTSSSHRAASTALMLSLQRPQSAPS